MNSYNSLFRFSARARREGSFTELVDLVRTIDRSATFIDSNDARFWLRKVYRRDRTEHQDWSVYLGVEKATLTALVRSWFEDRGLPIVTLRGYSSQTYVDEIVADFQRDGRPAVLLYIGDHDPSGKDIERDLQKRTGAFDKLIRVAVLPEQVSRYSLSPAPGKAGDSRAQRSCSDTGDL